MLVSMSITFAPMPSAICAAFEPTIPAPITVTVPGGDARHSSEQFPYATVLFFQEMGTYLH